MNQNTVLRRCQELAGEPGEWTSDNLSGFLHRFRPKGNGLTELYEGVPFGSEIVKRLKAVMKIDGSDSGLSLSVNNAIPVDEAKALSIARKFINNMRKLGKELGEEELTDLFPTTLDLVPRGGDLKKCRDNSVTGDALFLLCQIVDEALMGAANHDSAAAVMSEAIYTLVYDFPLVYYIQWPIYADCFRTKDPFQPCFDMWRRRMKWRIIKGGDIEVFFP